MMSVPFFLFAGGMGAAYYGHRAMAIALWVAGLAVMLFLFKVHLTEPLNLGL